MGLDNVNKVILYITTNSWTTIDKISEDTGIHKETVKRIVLSLAKDKILSMDDNKYAISDIFCNFTNKKSDIYFNLNIKKEHRDMINYLFSKIEDYWFKATGRKPTKTQMQKQLVEINNKLSLGLPVVWYKYGQIVPVAYDPSINYIELSIKNTEFSTILSDKQIYDLINENVVLSSKQIRKKQYESGNSDFNKLYRLKDEMLENLLKWNTKYLVDNFEKFTEYKPYSKELSKITDDYHDFLIYFERLDKTKLDYKIRNIYFELFGTFWDIMAINNYKTTIREYYIKNNLNLEELQFNFSFGLNKEIERFKELLEHFYECFTFEDFFNDPLTKRLLDKVLLGKKTNASDNVN